MMVAAGPTKNGRLVLPAMTEAQKTRFWSSLRVVSGECWEWTGRLGNRGYGEFPLGHHAKNHPIRHYAHRVAWGYLVGPVPDGLEIDHLCRNPKCVNPAHLEPVTHMENMRRARTPSMLLKLSGRCAKGHEIAAQPGRLKNGRCATCASAHQRNYVARKRARGAA